MNKLIFFYLRCKLIESGDILMFKVNDTVLYSTQGVCKITEIMEKKIYGKKYEYFVLKPIFDEKSTIFVPLNNEGLLSKMKRVITPEEIHKLLSDASNADVEWIENNQERQGKYKTILSQGTRADVIRLIKVLHLHQTDLVSKGKKLHANDERVLKFAEKLLYDEFALALNIKQDEVLPYILNEMDSQKIS